MAKKYEGVLAEKLPPGLDGLPMLPERWVALYQHYGLDHTNRDHDARLILAMACSHVPGFQSETQAKGKQYQGGQWGNRALMAHMVLTITTDVANGKPVDVSRAARRASRTRWAVGPEGRRLTVETLRWRFYQYKRNPDPAVGRMVVDFIRKNCQP
jgi:hypothetical protein